MLYFAAFVAGMIATPVLAWLFLWVTMRVDTYDPYNDSE